MSPNQISSFASCAQLQNWISAQLSQSLRARRVIDQCEYYDGGFTSNRFALRMDAVVDAFICRRRRRRRER